MMRGCFGLFLLILTLHLLHNQFSLFEVGVYAAVFSLSTVLAELPFGAMADRFGRIGAYRFSLLLNCTACALMIAFEHKLLIILAAGIFGMAKAMNSGTVDAWYVDVLRQQNLHNKMAYHLAHAELAGALGLACCPLLAGFVPDMVGQTLFHNPYKTGFALSCLMFICLLLITPILLKEPEPPRKNITDSTILDNFHELWWYGEDYFLYRISSGDQKVSGSFRDSAL